MRDGNTKMSKNERQDWLAPDLVPVQQERLDKLNTLLKKGKMSSVGFIRNDQNVVDIIREDRQLLRELGVTPEMISNRMEELCRAWLSIVEYPSSAKVEYQHFTIEVFVTLGYQQCPFEVLYDVPNPTKNYYGSDVIIITNNRLKRKVKFPSLLIHHIRHYCFFEGKGMPYRAEPQDLITVLEVK